MSETTATASVQALSVVGMSDEEFALEMLGLLEAIDFDYERWCRILDVDPDDDGAFTMYRKLLDAWPRLWTEMGDEFTDAMRELETKWRSIVDAKPRIR